MAAAVLNPRKSFTKMVPFSDESPAYRVAVMGAALAVGSPQHSPYPQIDWGTPSHPIQENQEPCLASCHSWAAHCQETAFLPWTSMTVRAPRVSLAPLLSFPRTSSTISAIWSLLFFRKSWPGHRKKHSVKVAPSPAMIILRVGITYQV